MMLKIRPVYLFLSFLLLTIFLLRQNIWNLLFNKSNNSPRPIPPYSLLPTPANRTSLKWGIFAGSDVNDFIDLRKELVTRPDFLPTFVHWGNENEFPAKFAQYAYLQDQTLVIYWEAMDYLSPNPSADSRYSYRQILSGKFDTYLTRFALSAKEYGRPVILVPFEEMNGDWYPWSVGKNGNSPEEHRQAYRYIHRFFKEVPNVKFAWVINNDDGSGGSGSQALAYYPGPAYVDYVGVNGFNFDDPPQSFSEIFSESLTALSTLSKPIIIFSMASAPGPGKSDWIKNAAAEMSKNPQIVGWIWFNENKEKDWRISSDPASRDAFNTYLLTSQSPQ